jgi:hypothetical protein
MTTRTIGRVVGALFLLAFVTYGTGEAMAGSASLLAAGALVMLGNSACVLGIAALVCPIIRRRHEMSAYAYAMCRTAEAVVLAVGIVLLLEQEDNHYAYQIGMIAASVAGLVFCRVLLQERLVPRFMAVWGLAGYAIFLTGSMLEVLGYPVGLVLSVPGGLFEVGLGVLLIARGFPSAGTGPTHRAVYSQP